jgi:hypothetical protein
MRHLSGWITAVLLLTGCATAASSNAAPLSPVPFSAQAVSQPVPGGFVPQPTQGEAIAEPVREATKLLAGAHWLNDPALKVLEVKRAESQVVAGTNYRLLLRVRHHGQARFVRVLLFEDLQGRYSLSWVTLGPPGATTEPADGTPFSSLSRQYQPPGDAVVRAAREQAAAQLVAPAWLGSTVTLAPSPGAVVKFWMIAWVHLKSTATVAGTRRPLEAAMLFDQGAWRLQWVRLAP